MIGCCCLAELSNTSLTGIYLIVIVNNYCTDYFLLLDRVVRIHYIWRSCFPLHKETLSHPHWLLCCVSEISWCTITILQTLHGVQWWRLSYRHLKRIGRCALHILLHIPNTFHVCMHNTKYRPTQITHRPTPIHLYYYILIGRYFTAISL